MFEGIDTTPGATMRPYRVWFNKRIIWFAQTYDEAEERLARAKRFAREMGARRQKAGIA